MTAGLAKTGDTSSLTCTQAPVDKEFGQSKKKRENMTMQHYQGILL